MTLMGARRGESEPGHTHYAQAVGPRFHDHRGRTILGSIGVLVDAVPGSAAGRSVPAGTQTVLSQVTAALAAPLPDHGELVARGHVVHLDLDTGIGLSAGDVTGPDGQPLAVLTARSVVVSRGATHADTVFGGDPLPVPTAEPVTDPAEFADLPGLDVVTAVASGAVARGPLAGLFGVELAAVEHGRVVAEFTPQPWMANYLGSVQGGNLIATSDLLTGLTAQTLTAPGQDYRALDLRIDFVRSPTIDGGAVRVESAVVRAGRRLALVETTLTDATGRLLARAAASVQLR
ncbi:PaaI family thioesterase [Rhodococcus spelaei]|uniref:PaaI family thioesterase n=2 Tax=Rhodococcus spelaei TaxID=2546320 RepID=A0A541BB21_9NOCA|nr:PaaI family thioesterase [Rhodococcus spelaei]